jgi:hypothetical protein
MCPSNVASLAKPISLHGPARRFTLQPRTGSTPSTLYRARPVNGWNGRFTKLTCSPSYRSAHEGLSLGRDIDWHRDPVSGLDWPPILVIKICSSTNAMQRSSTNSTASTFALAKAFFLTGDERYAFEAIVQIESWIQQNPCRQGINWQSSLEIGIRCISWLWTIFLLLESQCLNEESLRTI